MKKNQYFMSLLRNPLSNNHQYLNNYHQKNQTTSVKSYHFIYLPNYNSIIIIIKHSILPQ